MNTAPRSGGALARDWRPIRSRCVRSCARTGSGAAGRLTRVIYSACFVCSTGATWTITLAGWRLSGARRLRGDRHDQAAPFSRERPVSGGARAASMPPSRVPVTGQRIHASPHGSEGLHALRAPQACFRAPRRRPAFILHRWPGAATRPPHGHGLRLVQAHSHRPHFRLSRARHAESLPPTRRRVARPRVPARDAALYALARPLDRPRCPALTAKGSQRDRFSRLRCGGVTCGTGIKNNSNSRLWQLAG
jgi:hypothetical protein